MNTNDLYLEYARVIQMCKGTELEDTPWACVRWRWKMSVEWFDFPGHPNFSETNPSIFRKDVDFAVAVLEGRPVFVGDRIYAKRPNSGMSNGAEVIRDRTGQIDIVFDTGTAFSLKTFDNSCIEKYFTWTTPHTPKRTFTLKPDYWL